MIYFVAAHDRNFGMGSNTKPLPWPLMPSDKKHLHDLADGKNIVVGERTYHDYKDIQTAFKTNDITVISKSIDALPDAQIANSLDPILKRAEKEDLWVIGGGSIFTQLLPYVDVMQLTRIESVFEADIFFPKYTIEDWAVEEESHPAGGNDPFAFTFLQLTKKSS